MSVFVWAGIFLIFAQWVYVFVSAAMLVQSVFVTISVCVVQNQNQKYTVAV